MVLPPKLTDIPEKEEKIEEVEPLQSEEYLPKVKHIIRGLNVLGQFGEDRSEPVSVVENYLDSQLEQGYRLFYVQHLRSNMSPEGNTVMSEQMLYVLVKS
ncbi:MAG: hypothetical protein ACW97P_04595 [Candidatus Hodarchaeales archaeon]|jgi:hypothetical protein